MALTAEELRRLLDYDPKTGVFTWKVRPSRNRLVGAVAGTLQVLGYIGIGIYGKVYTAHRLAWVYMTGELPPNDVDHINGNRSDNRFSNLRLATRSENLQNTNKPRCNNKVGLQGVSPEPNSSKYRAQIRVEGTVIYLGLYSTPEEAHEVYLTRKRELHPFFVESTE